MRARSDYAVSDNFAFGHRGDSGIPMTKVRLDKRRHFRSIVRQSPLTSDDDVCVVDPQSPHCTLDGTRSCHAITCKRLATDLSDFEPWRRYSAQLTGVGIPLTTFAA
jgi:hypothetical protein